MNASSISNDIALRIGLAARELPDTDAARMLSVLDDAIGLPPTDKKLSGLTVKALKSARDGEFADVDTAALKSALGYLKGETSLSAEPLPEVSAYSDGDMSGSIRVACASNKGEMLDGHFGSCKRFLIYQVSKTENRLIEIRDIDDAQADGDKNGYRASLISDCQVLFVASIGGPAAAKVVRVGAHPIKKPQMGPAIDEITKLQAVIGSKAPPWLAKVMGQSPEERIRFEQEEATA
ncbi:MAG: dinitrogenase iron-molybdenum cofactor biosynthesis protein [gamma proteobacterium symbiont of Clathrolucina costata]